MFRRVRRWLAGLPNHPIARTATVNLISVVVTMFTGILLARGLGEEGRGLYASVVVWFGAALVLGELGQSAAVTYFVARSPESAKHIIGLGRRIMGASSFVVMAVAVAVSPILAKGDTEQQLAFVVAFLGLGVNGLLAPFIYALQALSISLWNLARVTQPVLNLLAVTAWYLAAPFTVLAASICLLFSYLLQMLLAYTLGRRALSGVSPESSASTRDLLRFGVKQASAAVPQTLAGSLDRIVLTQAADPAALGHYAVAQSVVGAAAPLGTAIASVVFPRMSAFGGDHAERKRIEVRLLRRAALAVSGAVVLLVAISPWAIPLVFGSAFTDSVGLTVWVAAPTLLNSLLNITTSFLRGRGTPGRASAVHLLALSVAALGMYVFVPAFGVRGAAIGASVGAGCALALALILLHRGAQ